MSKLGALKHRFFGGSEQGFYEAAEAAGVTATDVLAVASGATILHETLEFDYTDAVALKAGMTLFTPEVGDILLDFWIDVVVQFDGTTPKAEFGTFVNTTQGILYQHGDVTDLSLAAMEDAGDGVVIEYTNTYTWQNGGVIRFTATNPLKLVATQTGATDGTQLDSTVGEATAHALILRG